MSFTDFASVASDRGVLQQLANTPNFVQFVVLHSPVTKPWLSRLTSLVQSLGVMFTERSKSFPRNLTNLTFSEDYQDYFVPAQAIGMHLLDPSSTHNIDIHLYIDTPPLAPAQPKVGRRLLELDESVSRYSSLTAATDGFSNIPLGSSMADNWLEGPFGWPPTINSEYWSGDQKCTAAQVTLDVLGETGLVMKHFFDEYAVSRRELSWSMVKNIPTTYNGTLPIDSNYTSYPLNTTFTTRDDWPNVFFRFLVENVMENYLGITIERVRLFFTTLPGPCCKQTASLLLGSYTN